MSSNQKRYTRSEVQARYDAEVATIRAANEHPQLTSMALNEARRWLDGELDNALPDPLPNPQLSLGDKLRQNIEAAELMRLNKEERVNREARERRELRMREVSLEFAKIKIKIIAAIEQGSIPAPIRLPRFMDNSYNPISHVKHNDHAQWVSEMHTWAAEQGLILTVINEHDGMGMESWWSVKVMPA
jgi:hypothetical protein